jgi:carbamoyl-phosphate synthase large subunit
MELYPQNVLVTAANGDLAEAVLGVIRDAFPGALIHGTEIDSLWPAEALFDTVRRLPPADAEDYLEVLHTVADDLKVDIVIPCSEAETLRLAYAELEGRRRLPLLMPNAELVVTCSDKLQCSRWLECRALPTPRTLLLRDARPSDLPLIAKPRAGSGSAGIFKVTHPALLCGLQAQFGDAYVAQEYIEGDEYTCAILRAGDQVRALAMRRRLNAGRTISAEVVSNPAIDKVLALLADEAELDGLLNVQLRLAQDAPKIFEINARVSSTVKMRHMMGFRDLEWSIKARAGDVVPEYQPDVGASIYRLSREVLGRRQV